MTTPQAVRCSTAGTNASISILSRLPVRIDPVENMLDLRRRVEVPICINEGLWREADAYRLIKSRCGDYLCYSQYWVGSLSRWHMLNHTSHLEGWQVLKHTHGELGLTAAAAHHVMLACPKSTIGSQQTAQMMEDDFLVERIPIVMAQPGSHR